MLTEDFSIYFDPNGLGDAATIPGADISGQFSGDYVEVGNVEGYYPTFLVSDTDALLITKNSTVITINSITYTAISKRPDKTGLTLLILQKT